MNEIGELIDSLFSTHKKADGKEYTNQEVAEAVGVTHSYIGKLRAGKVNNPGRDTLRDLSLFFGVPIGYFFPELSSNDSNQSLTADDQLSLVLRSSGLNTKAQRYIRGLFDLLRSQNEDDSNS